MRGSLKTLLGLTRVPLLFILLSPVRALAAQEQQGTLNQAAFQEIAALKSLHSEPVISELKQLALPHAATQDDAIQDIHHYDEVEGASTIALPPFVTPSQGSDAELPLNGVISTRAADLFPASPNDEPLPIDIAQSTEENPTSQPAEATPATDSPPVEGSNLAQQAQNPIANLISIPFQNNLNFGVGPFDETQYVLNIQPVIPIELNDDWLLVSRIITPIISQPTVELNPTAGALQSGGSEFGLGDINPSFFFVPQTNSNITWGVGPALVLPTATDDVLGSGQWSAGPTGVIVITQGPWLYGVLASQVWSFAGNENRPEVSQFLIQPFVNYSLPQGWTIGSSSTTTANWNADEADRWTIPLGLTVSKLTLLGRQPVQFSLGGFYNIERPTYGAEWTLRFQVTLLFPTGS